MQACSPNIWTLKKEDRVLTQPELQQDIVWKKSETGPYLSGGVHEEPVRNPGFDPALK